MTDNSFAAAHSSPNYDKLCDPADPASSEAALRELLPSSGDSRAELLTVIARVQGQQKKFADANASLAESEKLLQDPESTYRVSTRIRWLLEKGRIQNLERIPSQARNSFIEAWTLAVNSGEDDLAVDVAQMMAAIEPMKAQQDWIARAVQIAESSPQDQPKRRLGTLYAVQAWRHFDVRQYEKSLEVFQKALSHLKSNGSPREAFVAKWSVGKVLRALNRTEEALTLQKSLLSELGIGGPRDGRVFEELAECLQTLKRSAEAQPYFGLAYEELSKDEWLMDNQAGQLKRLKELGKVK